MKDRKGVGLKECRIGRCRIGMCDFMDYIGSIIIKFFYGFPNTSENFGTHIQILNICLTIFKLILNSFSVSVIVHAIVPRCIS